jgi:hypothetical protein
MTGFNNWIVTTYATLEVYALVALWVIGIVVRVVRAAVQAYSAVQLSSARTPEWPGDEGAPSH